MLFYSEDNDYDNPITSFIAYALTMLIMIIIFKEQVGSFIWGTLGGVFEVTEISSFNGQIFTIGFSTIMVNALISDYLSYRLYTSSMLSKPWQIISQMIIAGITFWISSQYFLIVENKIKDLKIPFLDDTKIKLIVAIISIIVVFFLACRKFTTPLIYSARVGIATAFIISILFIIVNKNPSLMAFFSEEFINSIGSIIVMLIGIALMLNCIFGGKK